ncbi:hypothetical protein ACIGQE_23950 [Streptomyces sp. NPDC053429]|uniref:hypothetical protein n=1 Tax=unclassified Streptomyces TaxID=2593676 RepID=UPI0033DCB33C
MAKNKNRQQPAKTSDRAQSQDQARSSVQSSPEPSSAPSPMHMAGKRKEKKFGHN